MSEPTIIRGPEPIHLSSADGKAKIDACGKCHVVARTEAERAEAAHFGVEIPEDLPPGCGVAYYWVHEDDRLAELGSDDPAEVEREIAHALERNARTVREGAEIGEVWPTITREALVELAAYLRANAPEPLTDAERDEMVAADREAEREENAMRSYAARGY